MTVAAPEKTVKKINTQMSSRRTVTVERTGNGSRQVPYNRGRNGHTVTASRQQPVNEPVEEETIFDDYEELKTGVEINCGR